MGKGIILGLFVLILPLFFFVVAGSSHLIIHATLVKKVMPAIEQDFKHEMEMALQQTTAAVNEHAIDNYIASNNQISASRILNDLGKKYDLTTMVAVNKEGVAMARIPSPRTGDYVFQTTPWGQLAAQGQTTVMVGEGRNFPLLINSAVPILKNGEVQGALFGGYLLDDHYAQNFQKKYLESGREIVFYSKTTGVYGASFQDPETQRLLKIYFSQGSDAVQQTTSGLLGNHLRLGNTIFHVLNIKLANQNGDVGGMIVLTPVSTGFNSVMAISPGILLSLLVIKIRQRKHKNNLRRTILAAVILFITVVGSTVALAWIINQRLYSLAQPTTPIYNSTIAFAPESDLLQLTSQQLISIKITTGGEAINAARAVVQFNPQALRVEDILLTNSFCGQEFALEKQIDNQNGLVTIACGKKNGFVGDQAVLADLLVQPLKVGITDLQFGIDTQVLANDGLGTNVLRTVTNGSYQIITFIPEGQKDRVELFSYSHPNQTRWYNKKDIHINWIRPAGYTEYLYALDQNTNTAPTRVLSTAQTSIDLTADKDGVYYFHIMPRKSDRDGQVSHYKIMIDTTPPAAPEIKSSATTVRTGELVRFEFFNHGDNASGVQKNFYVQFDGGAWLPTLPQLYIPFGRNGKHTVNLRIFDNAGNFKDTSTVITAQSSYFKY